MKDFLNKLAPIHPFLFAVWPVLYLYSNNIRQLSWHTILFPMGALLLVTLIVWLLLKRWTQDFDKATIFLSGFWIWFFSYSAMREIILTSLNVSQLFRHRYFIGIWVLVLLAASYTLFKMKVNFQKSRIFFNIFATILISINLIMIIKSTAHAYYNMENSPQTNNKQLSKYHSIDDDGLPPIYYIILDAYSGPRELKEILDFDNKEFLNFLEDRGFYIADHSHSNYSWTILSMTATLNMEYLPANHNPAPRLLIKNKVMTFYKSQGYTIIDLGFLQSRGIIYKDATFNSFNLELLKMTLLDRPLVEDYLDLEGRLNRGIVLNQFKELKNVSNIQKPTFTYAHILIPHPPYVFDQNGNHPPFNPNPLKPEEERKLYVDQLIFTNKLTQGVVDHILMNSKKPPIIIIQGDHGSRPIGRNDQENKRLRMGILNAYYLPGEGRKHLYKSISPVNTFRVILTHYFGQNLPLYEDESYYSSTAESNQVNITDQLRDY